MSIARAGFETPKLRERIANTAREYPPAMQRRLLSDVLRTTFHVQLTLNGRDPADLTVCDLGGGGGFFAASCAAVGCKHVIMIDDFREDVHRRLGTVILSVLKQHGVEVIRRDLVADGLGDLGARLDAATMFGTMEHWHHSPKRLFHQVMSVLNPGGAFVLGGPNCLNLRKRIAWPLGRGYWSAMEDWYEREIFRGHVREPSVKDLHYIARDLGLSDVRILGRNWPGYISPSSFVRAMTVIADYPLRLVPSLCSSIYLVGTRC